MKLTPKTKAQERRRKKLKAVKMKHRIKAQNSKNNIFEVVWRGMVRVGGMTVGRIWWEMDWRNE